MIDVGASNGSWSGSAMAVFPDSRYLLIEAQDAHRAALQKFCEKHPKAEFVLSAAGAEPGHVYFDDSTLMGGSASNSETTAHALRVAATRIDAEAAARKLDPPYLIKLDTHGFEVPILDGAAETLESTALVVIEAYNFRLTDQSLLFHELCRTMADRGFSVIDMSDPLWRVADDSLWQMDLYFVPSDRPEFANRTFR